ncbi:MAG: hypothetical protein IPI55_09680 [Flavobacteriales bacterium]|nr:hypothetical protein [Flavobacteriales bacterium]
MGLFHTATDKEILAARKKIIVEVGIPALVRQGFERAPFSTTWFGYYPGLHAYCYEFARLKEGGILEIVTIDVIGGEGWIQIRANALRLHPPPASVEALKGQDGLQFQLPPNNRNEMRLRIDDRPGLPLFHMFARKHKLGSYWTRKAFEREVERLSRLIEQDMNAIDGYFDRWHALHQPMDVDQMGHPTLKT